MKIAEIEAKIEHGDFSEETLDLFKTALKRVPKSGRCQHCYTTAISMSPRFHKEAISLIQYGLTEHCDSWVDRMRSYYNLAVILETNEDYVGAKKAYCDALSSIDPDKRSGYSFEYAAHMMRMEMHISNFQYTDDLEKYYNTAIKADAFSQAFQKKQFYRFLAEIIIFYKHGNLSETRRALNAANEMLRPGYLGPLTQLLKRKGYIESAGATKAALAFLQRTNRAF